MALISQMQSERISEAMEDESWVQAMQEKIDQFERNQVWRLMERPKHCSLIGKKYFSQKVG